jgi:hypothetical protein
MDGGYSPLPYLSESWTFEACDSFNSRHKYVLTERTLKTAKGTALIYEYTGPESSESIIPPVVLT